MSASTVLVVIPQYSLYSDFITFIFGIIGNTINLLVFLHLKCFREQRITFYFIIEIIFIFINRFLQLTYTISSSIYHYDITTGSTVGCRLRTFIVQAAGNITYSLICLAAIDQYFSTNNRLYLRQFCTFTLARCVSFILICSWLLHSLLFTLYLDINPISGCAIWNPIWTQYATYFFYPFLFGLIPMTTASLFSLLAYRNVRRIIRRQIPIERRRFDHQITAMVLIRVIFFVLLVSPFLCYRIYIVNTTFNKVGPLEATIGRLVQAVTTSLLNVQYALSFYLYIIISPRYRRQVKQVLRKKIWQNFKFCYKTTANQIYPENPLSSGSNLDLE